MAELEQWRAAQIRRIHEFASFGIKATTGKWLGAIQFNAKDAEKLLRLLRKARRQAKKAKGAKTDGD